MHGQHYCVDGASGPIEIHDQPLVELDGGERLELLELKMVLHSGSDRLHYLIGHLDQAGKCLQSADSFTWPDQVKGTNQESAEMGPFHYVMSCHSVTNCR